MNQQPDAFQVVSNGDIFTVRRAARDLAGVVGFSKVQCTIFATVTSELARNVLMHAGQGTIHLDAPGGFSVRVRAEDQGPGITDPRCLYHPGHGLEAVRLGVNDLTIEDGPGGCGTRVTATLWLPAVAHTRPTRRPSLLVPAGLFCVSGQPLNALLGLMV